MMLSHLGLDAAARLVHRGVAELLQSHGPRTPDLGGTATTDQVGQSVLERVIQMPV